MMDKVKVELRHTNVFTRWPCHVCGGCTEKISVLAEVLEGPHQGLRVCERCLKVGDLDHQLAGTAMALEEQAAATRALIGRLEVPTYAEWEKAMHRRDVADFASYWMESVDGCGQWFEQCDVERDRVMTDDAAYQKWAVTFDNWNEEGRKVAAVKSQVRPPWLRKSA